MNILVTGGSGYIGSNTCVELLQAGHNVVIIDNLCNSSVQAIRCIEKISEKRVEFYEADVRYKEGLKNILYDHKIECVIHFAGLKAVGESVLKPLEYYQNNVEVTLSLLQMMEETKIKNLIFSSSATVYGKPATMPISEDSPRSAESPYGRGKLMQEQIFEDICKGEEVLQNNGQLEASKHWSIVLLRYFNPIGAHESGLLGENPKGIPNNLMPYIVGAAKGTLQPLRIFGGDYETVDGTGIRDYVHVTDLAEGHNAALRIFEEKRRGIYTYNLGTGKGTSVLELVKTFERVNQTRVPWKITDRREGDVSVCYADVKKSWEELGWQAKRNIEDMCRSVWKSNENAL